MILSTGAGGMHGCFVWLGGHAWLLEGMHGCWGVCVPGSWGCAWGHAWLPGGMHGCHGVHMVAGGVCGCQRACVVAGGVCMVAGGVFIGHDEIQSMSGQYASYWNAFLFAMQEQARLPEFG